jgi:hypothetical protein
MLGFRFDDYVEIPMPRVEFAQTLLDSHRRRLL